MKEKIKNWFFYRNDEKTDEETERELHEDFKKITKIIMIVSYTSGIGWLLGLTLGEQKQDYLAISFGAGIAAIIFQFIIKIKEKSLMNE